jgi:hypothetical protein
VEASRISRHWAYAGSKVVSPMHQLPLPRRIYSWYPFLLRGFVNPSAVVQPEEVSQLRIPVTSLGILPKTFQLIAQWLSQMWHHIPLC